MWRHGLLKTARMMRRRAVHNELVSATTTAFRTSVSAESRELQPRRVEGAATSSEAASAYGPYVCLIWFMLVRGEDRAVLPI